MWDLILIIILITLTYYIIIIFMDYILILLGVFGVIHYIMKIFYVWYDYCNKTNHKKNTDFSKRPSRNWIE